VIVPDLNEATALPALLTALPAGLQGDRGRQRFDLRFRRGGCPRRGEGRHGGPARVSAPPARPGWWPPTRRRRGVLHGRRRLARPADLPRVADAVLAGDAELTIGVQPRDPRRTTPGRNTRRAGHGGSCP